MSDPKRPAILLIDDDADAQKVLKKYLERWGYEALGAVSGEEGLRLAKERVPSLILLDILLPTIKGRDVCAQLKADQTTARIPIIILSALQHPDHIKTGMALGADDYLVKPFDYTDLKDRIRVCLLRHTA